MLLTFNCAEYAVKVRKHASLKSWQQRVMITCGFWRDREVRNAQTYSCSMLPQLWYEVRRTVLSENSALILKLIGNFKRWIESNSALSLRK